MSWTVNEKEFDAVTHLQPNHRYEYFIKKVADWQEVWSLWKDGWVLMGDKSGGEFIPVWPHPTFAEAYAHAEWIGYAPRKIELKDWLGKWIPGMEKDGRTVAVFPTVGTKTPTIPPAKLKRDLERELSQYE